MTSWRTIVGSSETLAATDLAKDVTAKIASVSGAIFDQEGEEGEKKQSRKALIEFAGHDKKLAAGMINCMLIAAMWGDDIEGWVGHWLTIGPDKVEVAGRFKGDPCLRVKGSPELTKTQIVTLALPRRRPFERKLLKTAAGKEPAYDTQTDEVAAPGQYADVAEDFDGLFPSS